MKIYSLEIWFNHVMVIRKISIINVQLVKDNFATRKRYHLKISTRNFFHIKLSTRKKQLATRKIVFSKFSTHKTQLVTCKIISLNLQLVKSTSQLAKSNLQHVI